MPVKLKLVLAVLPIAAALGSVTIARQQPQPGAGRPSAPEVRAELREKLARFMADVELMEIEQTARKAALGELLRRLYGSGGQEATHELFEQAREVMDVAAGQGLSLELRKRIGDDEKIRIDLRKELEANREGRVAHIDQLSKEYRRLAGLLNSRRLELADLEAEYHRAK